MMENSCEYYCEESSQNPQFAWCLRYRIFLDKGGRLCDRCENDKKFRKQLVRQYKYRYAPECARKGMLCEVFNIPTTDEQCANCKKDGLFRGFLRGQGQAAARKDRTDCAFRGKILRTEKRSCCGGKGNREIEIFDCAKIGPSHDGICAECNNYKYE